MTTKTKTTVIKFPDGTVEVTTETTDEWDFKDDDDEEEDDDDSPVPFRPTLYGAPCHNN